MRIKFGLLICSIITCVVAVNFAYGQSYEDIYIIRPDGLSALHYFSMRSPIGNIADYLKNKAELDSLLYLFPNDYQLREYHGELAAIFPEAGYALINYWPISAQHNIFTLTCDINSWHEGPFARGAVVVVFPSDFELISHEANVEGEWKFDRNVLTFFVSGKNYVRPTIIFRKKQEAITRDSIVEHFTELEKQYSKLDVNCDELMSQYQSLKARSDSLFRANSAAEAARNELISAFSSTLSPDVGISSSGAGVLLRLTEKILFASGKADVTKEGVELLAKVADKIGKEGHYKLIITGYTDNVPISKGSKFASNWHLSAARASSVAEILIGDGVPESQIEIRAKGPMEPIASNDTPEGRAQNRRIEIELINVKN